MSEPVKPDNTKITHKVMHGNTWYIRKDGKITGPFPAGQISQLLVIGRLKPDNEVSQDKEQWAPIESISYLIPDVLKDVDDVENAERLAAARRWADERREERREENLKTPSRQSHGRRHDESIVDVEYRQNRESIYRNFRQRPRLAIFKLFLFISLVAALLWGSFNYSPLNINDDPDCESLPHKGANWRNCNKLGLVAIRADLSESNLHSVILRNANLFATDFSNSRMDYSDLSGSNLSFGVFRNTNLKGSNFRHSDLRKADFSSANLSYADFSNATITDVLFKNADLSNAIWIDGEVCAKGSTGQCLK